MIAISSAKILRNLGVAKIATENVLFALANESMLRHNNEAF